MKKKKDLFDDYYSDGIYELGRIGNVVSLKNNLSEADIKRNLELLAGEYDTKKEEINNLIKKIRTDISLCNPAELLNAAISTGMMSLVNVMSESQIMDDQCFKLRAVEYIQSVLVSQENKYDEKIGNQNALISTILNDVQLLYQMVQSFYLYWGAKMLQQEGVSREDVNYIIEAQLMGNVRGKRYQFQQIENLKALLSPHTDKLQEVYSMSAQEVLKGLEKLEYSLSSARLDSMKETFLEFLNFQSECEGKSEKEIAEILERIHNSNEHTANFKKAFGLELYNVKNVTEWSDELIDSLSWKLGECTTFFKESEFAGWPVIDLPVQKKPFIKIDGVSYCFDYYNLFDNIYRIIQKDIKAHDNQYTTVWAKIQQDASEELVGSLFEKLLPGSQIFIGNYYPKNNSLKKTDENDVLVLYDNTIIVAEVKAGSFTYTPALTDLDAHKSSFDALIGKADYQCERTRTYIDNNQVVKFYDKDKNEKISFTRAGYKNLYTFCVTVDNFNAFEAKIEKMNFLEINSGTIAISIDDLEVYQKYFDSPLYFLHYLKQRKAATKLEKLFLNDELDHLGMYIVHNMYDLYVNEFEDCTRFETNGYRKELDEYFASLHCPEIGKEKPVQTIPDKMKEIIRLVEENGMNNRVAFTSFLLDFAPDTRQQFAESIQYLLIRQKELGRMIPVISSGEVSYGLFVVQDNIEIYSEDYRQVYMYANMLKINKEKYWYIVLTYNEKKELKAVDFRELLLDDIERKGYSRDALLNFAEFIFNKRVEAILEREHKKKIYPNDMCPCGSGKKYKECCGKKQVIGINRLE